MYDLIRVTDTGVQLPDFGIISAMDDLKKIMYGVTDFALMRRENAYFVDRTGLIRELEKTRYAMFLRPRRFGKSLLLAILQAYYDVDYAARFDELFGGLAIAANPTPEHGTYLVLGFNFSGVDKQLERVQESFDGHCSIRIDEFVRRQAKRLPDGTAETVLACAGCNAKLDALCAKLKGSDARLMILVDEYDNFTNTILAERGTEAYNALCHGEGFFKQFFTVLKEATTGTDAPVSRLFITGVSPVTMDDVTSGFNIGSNISLEPAFAALTGFTHEDLRTMLAYYRANAGFAFDEEAVFETMRRWYDNYRFSPETGADGIEPPCVASPTLVLYYMRYFLQNHKPQPDLIDKNLRTDYAKIRHVITESRRLNGNYHKLEDIVRTGGASGFIVDSFQAREITKGDNFVSFLYYMGILTIGGQDMGEISFRLPNLTIAEFAHDFIPKAYEDVSGIDPRIYDISKGLYAFARRGEWRTAVETACAVTSSYWKVRDAIEGERVVQTALASLLYVAHGPYIVQHEQEEGGGFVDIAIAPQLARYPEIGYAAQIELKYIKKDDAVTDAVLAEVRAEARMQLEKYAKGRDLARVWNLKPLEGVTEGVPGGTVGLKRILVVFHGGDVIVCEEIVG